ncbi:MAG TPA: RNA-binding domain-containing protein [Blastocatellia bacterium]|nr:RNA-binding domain-containing protein [Blastocatellia bacterium]
MARGRKFRSTRRVPDSERSLFEQKLTGRYSRTLDRNDLLSLVRGGEDTHLEFKIRLVNTEKIIAEIVAMANGGGGAMLFGVNDQRRVEGLDDPEQVEDQLIDICRNQIKPPLFPRIDKVSFDNGVRIAVLQVDDRRAPHSTPDNRYFIRIGSTKREADGDEIAALFARSRVASFEDMPLVRASIEDIDEALVWSYIRDLEGDLFREPEGFPTPAALRDLQLGVDSAIRVTPTLAGLLLFGRNAAVERIAPQSRLELIRFSGANVNAPVVERAEFAGNLAFLFDRASAFIRRYADLWDARPPRAAARAKGVSEPVPARANYPRDSVIEALSNMLIHRDYSIVEPASRVLMLDDRIEFVNPSRSDGVPAKSVEYGASARRNPRLHRVFTRPEYGAEPAHRGIPALRRAHYNFSRREPRIALANDEFRLEIYGV